MRTLISAAGLTGLIAATFLASGASAEREKAVAIPSPAKDVPAAPGLQTAVLAGGCFWGMEAVFERVKGVHDVTAGYAGGSASTATYSQVSSEDTKHAEAIRVRYDPRQVSYGTLLKVYFSVAHDPTQLNGQYPDSGLSYRSAIFPQNAQQKAVAAAYIAQLTRAHSFAKPITTKLEGGGFYPAEAYHQNFYDKNPTYPYIIRFDQPKVAAFRAAFPKLAKAG